MLKSSRPSLRAGRGQRGSPRSRCLLINTKRLPLTAGRRGAVILGGFGADLGSGSGDVRRLCGCGAGLAAAAEPRAPSGQREKQPRERERAHPALPRHPIRLGTKPQEPEAQHPRQHGFCHGQLLQMLPGFRGTR